MTSRVVSVVVLLLAIGCNTEPAPRFDPEKDSGVPSRDGPPSFDTGRPQTCREGAIVCSGNQQGTCAANGEVVGLMECRSGTTCFAGVGCRVCMPGLSRCGGMGRENQLETCRMDGSGWDPGSVCNTAEGQSCVGGRCTSRCDESTVGRSYLGCDYWPTITPNSQLGSDFQFAVVLSNPQTYPVVANITGGALGTPRTVNLAPGAIETVVLPWVVDLVQFDPTFAGCPRPGDPRCRGAPYSRSVLRRRGAYHVHTNGPIAAYQFNPLTYRSATGHASFTNDASLLLPQGVLTQRYTVSTFPNRAGRNTAGETIYAGGFASIVAVTGESTMVTVRPTCQVAVGNGVAPIAAGSTATFTLQEGDVLQIVATGVGDLTGTSITANLPVAVYVGHDCAFVPSTRVACDHLEEQLLPNETWGREYFVSALRDRGMLPSVVRILSQGDDNTLTYDPPSVRPSETINAGRVLEFATNQSFRVTGTRAFLVAQYMVGQGSDPGAGDPAMVFEVPVQQFRTSYDFYVPSTYPQNFINIVTPTNSVLTMDDVPVRGSMQIVSGYTIFSLPISSGPHRIRAMADTPFGIKVYGIAEYTSYMYPGGLDLRIITPG